jgi:GxxExxY protein
MRVSETVHQTQRAQRGKSFPLPLRGRQGKSFTALRAIGLIMDINELSSKIIGAAIEVHKKLGPGLLESVYKECICYELSLRGISFERQKPLPVVYKGKKLDCGYRLDIVVENAIILELKSCEKIEPIHRAQLLTYLKLSDLNLGLLLNFNTPVMRDGIVRIVNKLNEEPLFKES